MSYVEVKNIGIAERQAITFALDDLDSTPVNRKLIRDIRKQFNLGGLRDELGELNLRAVQREARKRLEAARLAHEDDIPVEPLDLSDVGRAGASWDDLLNEPSDGTYKVDKGNVQILLERIEKKENWLWERKPDGSRSAVPMPSAMQEAVANLEDALKEAQ